MKINKFLFTIVFLLLTFNSFGQYKTNRDYLLKKQEIGKSGMIVLTSWAGASIASGTLGWIGAKGEWKYFSQMNVVWGVINLGIALPGLLGSNKTYENGVSTGQMIKNQYSSEQTYLINGGLDFLYIGTGVFLRTIADKHPNNEMRLKGFGNSIILQGGFLLIFDVIQYLRHRRQRASADYLFIDGLTLSNTGIGLKYTFK